MKTIFATDKEALTAPIEMDGACLYGETVRLREVKYRMLGSVITQDDFGPVRVVTVERHRGDPSPVFSWP